MNCLECKSWNKKDSLCVADVNGLDVLCVLRNIYWELQAQSDMMEDDDDGESWKH